MCCTPVSYTHLDVYKRQACAQQERKQLLDKVYNGAAGELIAAFLKESHMTQAERDRLRKLLDEMEV